MFCESSGVTFAFEGGKEVVAIIGEDVSTSAPSVKSQLSRLGSCPL